MVVNKKFLVHSAVAHAVGVDAMLGGQAIRAEVPGVTIELIAVDGSGSQTLRLPVPEERAAEVLAGFPVGAEVLVAYATAAAAPAPANA
jgi:hypothetical protein